MAVDQTRGLHPRSNESESLEDGIQGSEIFRSSPEDPAVQPGLRTNCLNGIKNQGESRAKGGGGGSDKNDKAHLGEEERLVLQGSPATVQSTAHSKTPGSSDGQEFACNARDPGSIRKNP